MFEEMKCGACGNTKSKLQAERKEGMDGFTAFRFICECGCITEFRVGAYIRRVVEPKDVPAESQDGGWCIGWCNKVEPDEKDKPEVKPSYIHKRDNWPPSMPYSAWETMEADELPTAIIPWIKKPDGTLPEISVLRSIHKVWAAKIYNCILHGVFDEERSIIKDLCGTLYFIDLCPRAGWPHDCLYIMESRGGQTNNKQ